VPLSQMGSGLPLFLGARGQRRRHAPGPRFPGDPGEGRFYVGWDETSSLQHDIAGTPFPDTAEGRIFDAGSYWNGRPLTIYHSYNAGGGVSTTEFDRAIDHDAMASLTFKLDTFTPAQISAGSADATLATSVTACKSRAPYPAWLCYYHEPEDNFTTSGQTDEYRAAFRYIVQYFRDNGVTNVAWYPIFMSPYTFEVVSGRDWRWWHPDWNGGTTNTSADWYRGSAQMMDLLGLDIYNAGISDTDYEDFNTNITTVRNKIASNGFGPMPPVFIAETGMSADTSPWPAGTWVTDYGVDMRNFLLSSGVGVCYYNGNDDVPPRYDFQPASDSDGNKLAGWRVVTAAASNFTPPG
jgi:hypothetical protein